MAAGIESLFKTQKISCFLFVTGKTGWLQTLLDLGNCGRLNGGNDAWPRGLPLLRAKNTSERTDHGSYRSHFARRPEYEGKLGPLLQRM